MIFRWHTSGFSVTCDLLLYQFKCETAYDCRIVFDFVKNPELPNEEILLLDIGSHDEVY